jgi:hypothetical protein
MTIFEFVVQFFFQNDVFKLQEDFLELFRDQSIFWEETLEETFQNQFWK